ncbi:MAG TPA: hypothetical protein VFG15_12350 [Amycolatopsis sp.]|nr:hypothetical protein [Amycolatopsis sp.]
MDNPENIHLVVGPPRCASTAFARVLWNNPEIRYYSHEPYESTHYRALDPDHADAVLADPLDLHTVIPPKDGKKLLVKEMTFQVGKHFPRLLARTAHPVVFLVRDPRLTISSRRRIKASHDLPTEFPLTETGWPDLVDQLAHCREHGVEYLLVDSHDYRTAPGPIFERILSAWDLRFEEDQLRWRPQPELALSNHGADYFYSRVLNSTGIEPPTERIPAFADFPAENGLRDHVEWATAQYDRMREDGNFVRPSERSSAAL